MSFKNLGTRIALTAGFFTLVSVGLLSFILVQRQREQVRAEVVHGSESLADAIALSVHRDMQLNHRGGVREMLETVGQHEGIAGIRLYNREGRISYSSDPAEVGRVVPRSSEACVTCHANGQATATVEPDRRWRIFTGQDGERLLGTIHVIRNEPGCQGAGCHASPAQQSVLGVLDVAMSMAPVERRLASDTRDALLISLLAVAVITLLLVLLVRRSVRRPIQRMVSATRRMVEETGSLPVPRGTAPEIAILAESFNEMIESLASSKQRLEDWAETLEERVSSKAQELREAQFEVLQAEKLSSVGLVAAGIAHELNSPLMAIITFSHLVKSAVPDDEGAQEDLRMIEREANRCAAIIRQLLDYSRKQAEDPETHPQSVAPVLERALELVKVELQNGGFRVTTELSPDLPSVEVNDQQLMQVFVNLIMNALHAMGDDGGEILFRGDTVRRDDFPNVDWPLHGGTEAVRIRVRDTGPGIAREKFSKIFDPFYTTKPVGQGSGLGLAVSLGIVRGYRGTIMVDSDGESWTEFTILLPTAENPAMALTS